MAYFNYFIKCIIRNISYKLCKPKVFLTVLLSVAILFGLKHFGYCVEWSQEEINACLGGLADITNNQGVLISQLSSMGVDVRDIENNLNNIKSTINNIKADTNLTVEKLHSLLNKVDSLNTTLTQMAEQQNIYYQNVTNELQNIKDILLGTDSHLGGFIFSDKLEYSKSSPSLNTSGNYDIVAGINFGYVFSDILLEPGYTYTFVCNSGDTSDSSGIYYTFDKISVGNTISVVNLGSFTPNSAVFSITPKKSYSGISLLFTNPSAFTSTDWSIYKKSSSSLSSVTENIDKNNQLQQNQNNLQQEQNDFLKNDNVSVDSSSLPSDTSQDITEDGFNSIFQQIYNTFTGGAAQDIVITIPFTNKSFTINANTVYGGANLGFIRTLIEAFWYFIISYFIVQDIGKKINKIKSGDIEHVQEDNIKEDLL